MKCNPILLALTAVAATTVLTTSCTHKVVQTSTALLQTVGNPYLPLWEHVPDGEPYVFDDPDRPGHKRVYIYGSHDSRLTDYCGREQVVWSADVDDLNHWRYDGVSIVIDKDANGLPFDSAATADVLYAPDIAEVKAADGSRTYYLYPNDQNDRRMTAIARGSRPDGPFEVCNWRTDEPQQTEGVLVADPAVLVDDDGRVYGYWGFQHSCAAELDPATMCTVKPGTEVIRDMITPMESPEIFRFFEASSIRKIKDKYVFIYSRWTEDGEFGLPVTNYTLAYAYSDHPLGPWTYGGTIIDGRGRETDEQGRPFASATVTGNTHGSICEINGQWYVFYHRQTGTNEFARQAMVAPITVTVEEGPGGKVDISEGEYTSEGFALNGLDPLERHSAGIACWYSGPREAKHGWPDKTFYGSYVAATYGTESRWEAPYDLKNNSNPVVNNTDGSIVGYKYFNFSKTSGRADVRLMLRLIPEGVDGTIRILADRPWTSQGGLMLGEIALRAGMPEVSTELTVRLPQLSGLTGKHALFFTFHSPTKERSLCTLEDFQFE